MVIMMFGCTKTRTVVNTVVEVCPTSPPKIECLDFPKKGKTLRDLLLGWEKAKVVHAECSNAVNAWAEAWEGCKGQ